MRTNKIEFYFFCLNPLYIILAFLIFWELNYIYAAAFIIMHNLFLFLFEYPHFALTFSRVIWDPIESARNRRKYLIIALSIIFFILCYLANQDWLINWEDEYILKFSILLGVWHAFKQDQGIGLYLQKKYISTNSHVVKVRKELITYWLVAISTSLIPVCLSLFIRHELIPFLQATVFENLALISLFIGIIFILNFYRLFRKKIPIQLFWFLNVIFLNYILVYTVILPLMGFNLIKMGAFAVLHHAVQSIGWMHIYHKKRFPEDQKLSYRRIGYSFFYSFVITIIGFSLLTNNYISTSLFFIVIFVELFHYCAESICWSLSKHEELAQLIQE